MVRGILQPILLHHGVGGRKPALEVASFRLHKHKKSMFYCARKEVKSQVNNLYLQSLGKRRSVVTRGIKTARHLMD